MDDDQQAQAGNNAEGRRGAGRQGCRDSGPRLVNRHGGTAWAESQVEQGATFFFTLPAATAGPETAPA